MKLKDMSIEELETMSYDDIALMVLTESGRQMKVNELFKEVCNLLNLSEDEFMNKLPAFFELLSSDHRFIMLENGMWDLKTKHSTKVVIDNDEEDDEDEIIEEEEDEIIEEDDEDIFYDENANDDPAEDDLKDLVIIDEDDEANGLS